MHRNEETIRSSGTCSIFIPLFPVFDVMHGSFMQPASQPVSHSLHPIKLEIALIHLCLAGCLAIWSITWTTVAPDPVGLPVCRSVQIGPCASQTLSKAVWFNFQLVFWQISSPFRISPQSMYLPATCGRKMCCFAGFPLWIDGCLSPRKLNACPVLELPIFSIVTVGKLVPKKRIET